MAIFKCKICGGTLEITSGETVATCEYCGTKQTLPKLDDEKKANLFDRANHFRRNNDFDKAMGIYEQILNEDTEDAECYWSIVLCRYGIEYVEDPSSRKRVPTVNRAQFTSVFDDEDYKSAIKYADAHQRELYEKEATAINEIQKGILAISGQEEPFDVFICYKETDANGRRTQDSVLATELYHELTREGYKVFFSRITLEDKLGTAYEPYIFAALNSSKVMVVLGTKPEHFNAVWVKNEWARYLALIKQGQKKMLIPAYRDMDPYDLPEEFSHLQAQDMSKLGFMQDLVRGITKLVSVDNSTVVKETVVVQNAVSGNTSALVKRGFLALEDGDWNKADDFFEQALNQNAEDAQAYLGKLMAELQVKTQSSLKNCKQPFDNSTNYQKAVRFADSSLASELKECISFIKDRNAKKAKEEYNESIYFRALEEYQSSDVGKLNDAIELFSEIAGWKDSKELIGKCQAKIEQIRVQEENERIARERLAEEKCLEGERKKELKKIEREKAKKRNKKLAIIITPIVVVIVSVLIILNMVIIPNSKYNAAIALINDGKYSEAIAMFELLDGYKDSDSRILECKCSLALELYNEGNYDDAKDILLSIQDYEDLNRLIGDCYIRIGDYQSAIDAYGTNDIIIPDGITHIKSEAFKGCDTLTSITIPASVISIGKEAFEDCKADIYITDLTKWCGIEFNDYSASPMLYGEDIYLNGKLFTEIDIPNDVTEINNCAFAFWDCLTNIVVPDSVNSIGSYAFASCDNLEKVVLPSKLTTIEDYTFAWCDRLSQISIPDTVTRIGEYAFIHCNNLTDMSIPEGISKIEMCTFANCNSLKEITLPESVISIEERAFSNCENLIIVSIPKGIKYLGESVFEECTNLTKIEFGGTINDWMAIEKEPNWDSDMGDYSVYCTDGQISAEQIAMLECNTGDVITFGSYEQDGNLNNGTESIEWLVLERTENKAFVISLYCLEQKPFNETLVPVTWENSTIRKWLNTDFFNNAFAPSERTSIISSSIKNPDDEEQERYSQNTIDKIFLLSSYEASIYFDSDYEREAQTTDYVGATYCYWILRTPSVRGGPYVCHVDYTGKLGYSENVDRQWYIRPAMWIDISNIK